VERKAKLTELLKELPESNQHTLKFLMTFLKALSPPSFDVRSKPKYFLTPARGEEERKETKLADVGQNDFMRMETQRSIVETFLDDYEDIFPLILGMKRRDS